MNFSSTSILQIFDYNFNYYDYDISLGWKGYDELFSIEVDDHRDIMQDVSPNNPSPEDIQTIDRQRNWGICFDGCNPLFKAR